MKAIQFKNAVGVVGNHHEVLSLLGGQISYVGTSKPQQIAISYRRNDFNAEIHFGDWIIEKDNKEIVVLSHDEFLALHSISLETPNLNQIIHDAIQKIIRDEKRQGSLLS
ncbi:protein kinase family protein [Acinetobacter pollinis]|uniref:Uncharacterized protein n=1 Tax=Acinetobacter pollinis TaxID=2605270 RepID=A0ABU6DPA7_9GAMM|nr:hypothetical protein [Acinetobacter pollinis]MEB5475540.1 hypothetical protein [Acinetobacter pollinis]